MNVKRTILLLLTAVSVLPALAQYGSARERSRYDHHNTERYYGLRLGLNIASLASDIVDLDMDARTGFAVGGVYGMQLVNSTPLWFETGLFYSEKGGRTDHPSDEVKCRLSYLQVPVVVKYSFDVLDDLYIQPFLGGYLALGIGGKTKNYATRESTASFDRVNRFDGGLRFGCGVEYKMLYGELGLDLGLTNISKGDFESVRTRNIYFNIGVNF